MTISQAVTTRILELTKKQGISVYKLEQKSHVSHETVKSIMKEKTKGVNLKTLIAIADGLKMSVSEFLDSELFDYDNLDF